jgi:hypothetical protein
VIAASTCSSCVSATFGGGGGQYILGEAGFATLWSGTVNILGVGTDFSANGASTTKVAQLNSIGNVQGSSIQVRTNVANAGLQTVTASGCAISAGAVGNFCTTAITLPVTEPDTAYDPVCSITGSAGQTTVGTIANTSTSVVTVTTVALTTVATGSGTIHCTITHR